MSAAAQSDGFSFSSENEARLQKLLTRYPTRQAVVLPALWLALEQNGHLTPEIMDYVAERLEQPPVQVYSVVEFYTMFHTEPKGEHHMQMCRTLTCTMCGYEELAGVIESELGIKPGQKTKDGKFSFDLVECLGSCGTAPVMRMNNRYFENLNADKLRGIIAACKEGRDPAAEDE